MCDINILHDVILSHVCDVTKQKHQQQQQQQQQHIYHLTQCKEEVLGTAVQSACRASVSLGGRTIAHDASRRRHCRPHHTTCCGFFRSLTNCRQNKRPSVGVYRRKAMFSRRRVVKTARRGLECSLYDRVSRRCRRDLADG